MPGAAPNDQLGSESRHTVQTGDVNGDGRRDVVVVTTGRFKTVGNGIGAEEIVAGLRPAAPHVAGSVTVSVELRAVRPAPGIDLLGSVAAPPGATPWLDLAEMLARKDPELAEAYGFEGLRVDGMDPIAVYLATKLAANRARAGNGPTLIEALTYRHGGHSRADPGKYRPDDEVAAWKARDPIPASRERLLAAGVDETALDTIDKEAAAKVTAAEAEARAAPEPSGEVLETQVWADGGSSWRGS